MMSLVGKLLDAGRRKARRASFYIAAKALDLFCDLGYGEMPLTANDTEQLKEAAALLSANQGAVHACEVHHFVLSGRKGTPNEEAFPVLKLAARDWINQYAPGRRWMAALQDHNGSPHLHLIVQNVGDEGKALKLHQWQVREMAAMSFTEHAMRAKGIGKKGLTFYSKAEGLDVQRLARELAHVYDPAEGLSALVERHPDLGKFRRRANGQLISFAYGGERIRLKTLQFYVDEILTPATPPAAPAVVAAAPTTHDVSAPVPVHLDPNAVNELLDDLNQLQPRTPRLVPPKIKPPQLPPL